MRAIFPATRGNPITKAFYASRQSEPYYRIVHKLLDDLGPLKSILDVGCWDSPVATWGRFTRRYTLDQRPRPALPDVTTVIGTWPQDAGLFHPVDVVTCLQVLEHVPDPASFAQALFDLASQHVIISVPYRWPADRCKWHLHDPVDHSTLSSWTAREPDAVHITAGPASRLVARYDLRRPLL